MINSFFKELITLFKGKKYKVFEYCTILLFLSNIFPKQLNHLWNIFEINFLPILNWLEKYNFSVNNIILLYCILVTVSIFRIIFHIFKAWADTGEMEDFDNGMLYNFNTFATFFLLIFSNIFPNLVTFDAFNYAFEQVGFFVTIPLTIFGISFVVTQFSFIANSIKRINQFTDKHYWGMILCNIEIVIFFIYLLHKQLLSLLNILLFLKQHN